MIDVLVVDDHAMMRVGLRRVIAGAGDMRVVGMAADGAQALAALTTSSPGVVLMDLSMPVMDGLVATRRITKYHPDANVLVLTSYADQQRVVEAMDAGAIGYVLKDATPGALLAAIRWAAQGHSPLDPRVARTLLQARPAARPAARTGGELTDREREVLALVGRGLANKQIARALGVREGTVKAHLTSAYQRIGVRDRPSAVSWARTNLPDVTGSDR
jgi:DNA-binding NarL/FixJ family response regulator